MILPDLTSLKLSLRLAALTTTLLFIVSIPLAHWLATTTSRYKVIFEALTALPLVLPPTVLGFYLLLAFGNHGLIGQTWSHIFKTPLAFSFVGLVIASVIYSLPFVVQPLQTSFSAINENYLETASTLGASFLDRFFTVKLPLAKRGLITAAVLGFTHTLGEFGVVLMIGGNIPGKTQLVSIDIYNQVELFHYHDANVLSLLLLLTSFITLIILYTYNHEALRIKL